ncbi:hypothetical protein QE152_g1455 [Popillia japonica]|uniref:CFAP61 dimerisation domain-containing protein n=1 Tax=Popillia japonica TaxID=7064 RepID=A0AAW1N3R2_POPJA
MKQCYFNRTEIGNRLGRYILNNLMRSSSPVEDDDLFSNCSREGKRLVPRYTQPLSVSARLPGKINYMSVKKPGVELVPRYTQPLSVSARLPGKINYMSVKKPGVESPLHVAMTADDYGQVLTSGDCKNIDEQGY